MNQSELFTLAKEATLYTFKVQASLPLLAGNIRAVGSTNIFNNMILATISLHGHFEGIMVICFPQHAFKKVLVCMLGEEYGSIEESISVAAEILNVIHGQIKGKMSQQNLILAMARPVVQKEFPVIDLQMTYAMPFAMDEENGFFIAISVKQQASAA